MILTINGVDKTAYVKTNSINKTDNLNSQVDNLTFQIDNFESTVYKPSLNDEVIITNGAIRIFGGVIVKIDEKISASRVINYTITCNDYSQYLKKSLVTKRFTGTTLVALIQYLVTNYTTGFTCVNIAGDITVTSFAFNRLNVADCLQKLADAISYVWYVDYNKDIHFFPQNTESAPFNLSDTSNNFITDSLTISEDLTQIRNSILVQGGNAISAAPITEYIITDGLNKSYPLVNKFSDIPTIILNGVTQVVGAENVEQDSGHDVMWNYTSKSIRFISLPAGSLQVSIAGLYEYPILVNIKNPLSVGQFGKYEFAITDKSITSSNEAIERAKAELKSYQNQIYDGSFRTYTDGLRSGMVININSTKRNRNINVLIQAVTTTMRDPTGTKFEYAIKYATLKSIGIIQYLQDQLRDREIIADASQSLLNYIELPSDSLSVSDNMATPTKTSGPYKWSNDAGSTVNKLKWGLGTWA